MNMSSSIPPVRNKIIDHLLNEGCSWDDYKYLLCGGSIVSDYGVDHERFPDPVGESSNLRLFFIASYTA